MFVWPRGKGEFGKKVCKWRGQGECLLPLQTGSWKESRVAVGGEDVHVPHVERRDGDGSAPEDEMLREFADLGQRERVALTGLIEPRQSD